ncbi:MAG: MFS transporter [Burkholderiales bacterium]
MINCAGSSWKARSKACAWSTCRPRRCISDPGETSWRHPGWRVVLTCFFLALAAWGFGFYGHGVYLTEIRRAHGWSTTLISAATTYYYLIAGVLVACAADAIERIGPRKFLIAGVACLALGTLLIPHIKAPWQLFAAYTLLACGWAGTSLGAIVVVIGGWFHAKRGMAISLALNGASASSVILVPLLVAMSAGIGFKLATAVAVGLTCMVLVPMILFWITRPPASAASRQSEAAELQAAGAWTKRHALGSSAFWSATLPFALGIAAQVGFLIHQLAVLQPVLGRVEAAFAVALTGAFAVVGRVGLSFHIDRMDPRHASAVLLAIQALALMLIANARAPEILMLACAAFGIGVGNLITLPSLVVQREFSAAAFARVASLATAVCGVTYAFAPGLLGLLRDVSDGYAVPLYVCVALELAAAALTFWRPRAGEFRP